MPEQIRETAGAILEAAKANPNSTYPVLLISEGKGSSGFYPRETLQEAARSKVIPAGTFSFIDHPTDTDRFERPERSVKDLAAVTTTDARWSDEHNGLVAEMHVFGPYQPLISEVGKHIGLSILGDGDIEMREGQKTVTHLAHVNSVDWVTRAGRGGKVLERLLESARQPLAEARNVGQHLESRLHQDFTNRADDMAAQGHLTRDERIHLSNAVGKGLTAFASHLEENAPQLYARDIYDEPPAAQRPDVTENATTTVPARSGAVTPPPKEGLVPELTEAEVTALRDQAARAEAAERLLAESTARLAALTSRDTARPLIAARLAEATEPLPPLAQARVVEHVLAAGVPTNEQGVNVEALHAAVEAAATSERAYLIALTPQPSGPVFGAFGSQQGAARTDVAEADAVKAYDEAAARTFGREIKGN